MNFKTLIIMPIAVTTLVACASTSTTKTAKPSKTVAEKTVAKTKSKTDKKKGVAKVFSASLDDTRKAAVSGLKKNGFLIKDDSGNTITGERPNRIGLLIGSGGEKISVELKTLGDMSTEARVKTKKTFVGYAGQKNWDDEVIAAMTSALQ